MKINERIRRYIPWILLLFFLLYSLYFLLLYYDDLDDNSDDDPLLDDDDVGDILDYSQYGKCVYKPDLDWSKGVARNDLITYDCDTNTAELKTYLQFDPSVDAITRKLITEISIEYWDSFSKEGAERPILGYDFRIDTGGAKPVCCRKPSYGP